MSGGSQESKSNSAPLTGAQRRNIFRTGDLSIKQAEKSPTYRSRVAYADKMLRSPKLDPGNASTLTGGDYRRLENNLKESLLQPVYRDRDLALENSNQDASDRGIFTTGLALANKNDVYEGYAPQIRSALGEAVAQRYGLEAQENQQVNDFNLRRADLRSQNVDKRINNRWRPSEYLQGLWNGTGGTVSSSQSDGWSI